MRKKSITAILVVISLVSGAAGCKLNPGQSWYKPNSYTWFNPFTGPKGDGPKPYDQKSIASPNRPNIGQTPDIATPPGGYVSDESRFLNAQAGNAITTKPAQNGLNTPGTKVASTNGGYAPYDSYDAPLGATTPTDIQRTSIYTPAPGSNPAGQVNPAYNNYNGGGSYNGTGIQDNGYSVPSTPAYPAGVPATTPPAGNGYSPYGAIPANPAGSSVPNPALTGAAPVSTPVYQSAPSANSYGVPTATPGNVNPNPMGAAPTGFGTPQPATGGFSATPSAYGNATGGYSPTY
jgi:hypothetical protein